MSQGPPTIQDRILARIRARGRGRVHIPQDFLDLGSRAAVDSALHRLVRAGAVERPARGLYHHPAVGRFGPVPPEETELVAAIARRTGSVVQLDGQGSLNRLGLSTQVPARSVYLTDGPSRVLRIGGREIAFRNTSSRYLVEAGTPAGLVVQALRALGSDGVTEGTLTHLRQTLGEDDLRRLRRIRRLPAWLQKAIEKIARG